jgi:signal transduction histidine kinase
LFPLTLIRRAGLMLCNNFATHGVNDAVAQIVPGRGRVETLLAYNDGRTSLETLRVPLRWSIFAQLLTLLSALVVGSLALGVWAAAGAAERAAREQVERQIADVLQTVEGADFPLTDAVMAQLKRLTGLEFVVVEPSGDVFGTFAEGRTPVPSILDEAKASMGARRPTVRMLLGERRKVGDRWHLASTARAPLGKANTGRAVAAWIDEARLVEGSAATRAFLWKLFGGGCVTAVLLAVLISRWFSRRLQKLEVQARRIADGDFRESQVAPPKDELASVAIALNETAVRLAAATESLKRAERLELLGRLGGGLAHQLRNHVAGARLALETGADDEAVAVAIRQLTLAERDLQRFLEIGREPPGDRKEVRPSRIVDEALELLRPRAKHLGIDLVWTPPTDERPLVADEALLSHIVANLTMNAMEAAGPGGTVGVEQRSGGDHLEWRVSDTGAGPPAELAATLFEPFVTGKPHGIGLGLAVVRHAVQQHGGTVAFHREEGRTVFVVRLPWSRLPS